MASLGVFFTRISKQKCYTSPQVAISNVGGWAGCVGGNVHIMES